MLSDIIYDPIVSQVLDGESFRNAIPERSRGNEQDKPFFTVNEMLLKKRDSHYLNLLELI